MDQKEQDAQTPWVQIIKITAITIVALAFIALLNHALTLLVTQPQGVIDAVFFGLGAMMASLPAVISALRGNK